MMTKPIQALFENLRKIKYDERISVIHHPPFKDDHRYHGTFLLEALFYIVENCIQYTSVNGFVSLVLYMEYVAGIKIPCTTVVNGWDIIHQRSVT